MATGDGDDFIRRLRALIPSGWIGQYSLTGQFRAYVSQAVLGGIADSLSWCYALLQGAKAATRRLTLTGWLIDLDAVGFLGTAFLRRFGEADGSFSLRYRQEVFRPRGRRQDIVAALTDLTGRKPILAEPWNAGDAGGYGMGGLGYGGGNPNAGLSGGYGASVGGYGAGSDAYFVSSGSAGTSRGGGFYGSLSYPFQVFITALRPKSGGIPIVAGYGMGQGGYGAGAIEYADIGAVQATVSDADIYACIARNTAAGIIPWVAIQD